MRRPNRSRARSNICVRFSRPAATAIGSIIFEVKAASFPSGQCDQFGDWNPRALCELHDKPHRIPQEHILNGREAILQHGDRAGGHQRPMSGSFLSNLG